MSMDLLDHGYGRKSGWVAGPHLALKNFMIGTAEYYHIWRRVLRCVILLSSYRYRSRIGTVADAEAHRLLRSGSPSLRQANRKDCMVSRNEKPSEPDA